MNDINDDIEELKLQKIEKIFSYINKRVDFEAHTLSLFKDRKSIDFFYHKGNYDTLCELANFTKRVIDERN